MTPTITSMTTINEICQLILIKGMEAVVLANSLISAQVGRGAKTVANIVINTE
ncbi:MAG: hypothetical protein SWO11_06130 [Thermodesulfobacteriota bacterium]|nr:hypothetical protein [Thermodesulfobacteriota bacterium]